MNGMMNVNEMKMEAKRRGSQQRMTDSQRNEGPDLRIHGAAGGSAACDVTVLPDLMQNAATENFYGEDFTMQIPIA